MILHGKESFGGGNNRKFYRGIMKTNIGYAIRKEEQKRILFLVGIKYNTYAGKNGYDAKI